MLSCDVMLRTTQPYAGLIQLSGTLLAAQEWSPLLQKRKGLPVFQSHGMQDELLPYVGAERLRDTLIMRDSLLNGIASVVAMRFQERFCSGWGRSSPRRLTQP